MTGPLGNSEFCFPQISMFPSTSSRETLRFEGNKIHCSPRDQLLSVYYFTFLAMHSGKSVFILCGKHYYILAITRQFISLQPGINHSQKLRRPSFLKSNLTNLSLIASWRLFHGVQSWAETIFKFIYAGCGTLRL